MLHVNPKVSIIIPAYNSEKYLSICLDSISIQTYDDFELIIINDASIDSTKVIISDFIISNKGIPVKYFENKTNIGQAASLNIGIENANGKFICMVDSDDTISSDYLFQLYQKIYDQYDFIYCGFDIIDSVNNRNIIYVNTRKYLANSDDIINQYMTAKNHFSFVGAIYRKEFLTKHNIRFNEANRYGCDIEFICDLFLKRPRCSCVDKSLYYYLIRPNSLTTDIDCPNIFHCVEGMQRIQKKIHGLRKRLLFSVTKKANMIYHVIMDLYWKQTKKESSTKIKLYYTYFFLIQVVQKPSKRFTNEKIKALIYFLK
ncbi:MAG: glycosyltransferase family 2 protein [Flavobacteriaceae bacterium]|nr:glycosyltransferase family 2 protein [Flavobacteriaceae bacterium]